MFLRELLPKELIFLIILLIPFHIPYFKDNYAPQFAFGNHSSGLKYPSKISPVDLAYPSGVAIRPKDGNIMVTDERRHIKLFSKAGDFIGTIGPNDQCSKPGIIKENGNIWIIDGANRLQELSETGIPLSIIIGRGVLSQPSGIARTFNHNPKNRNFVISDRGMNKVMIFTTCGEIIKTIEADFDFPMGVSIGPRNEIFVCDFYNGEVKVFDKDGGFIWKCGGLRFPRSCLCDGGGNFVVCEEGRLSFFDEKGGFVRSIVLGTKFSPHGIAMDTSGNLIVTDCGGHLVHVLG